jgi:nucleoside 2-deoxyribosyltransferase
LHLSLNDTSLCFSKSMDQMDYFMRALAASDWIDWGGSIPTAACIRAAGWNRVADLQRSPRSTDQVFVAMAFTDELEEAWHEGFHAAIVDAGLRPLRLDKTEHNEKICDLIMVEIARSCVLVADVTHHRQGVYFEAGYAMGLKIPVIWTCRADEKEKCHFDTRQYNHIFWSDAADLRKHLKRRVQATIL